jgi:hypothetical protein
VIVHRYEVGKPYGGPPRPEGVEFNFRGGECELIVVLCSPAPSEVEAVRAGKAQFGLYKEGDQILLCYKFGVMPWSDAPYHHARLAEAGVPEEQRRLPPDPDMLTPESRAVLHVILLDTRGIVRVLRAVTFSPEFTRALFSAIRDQAARPYHRGAYEAGLDRLYAQFTSDRLAAACRWHCEGGS